MRWPVVVTMPHKEVCLRSNSRTSLTAADAACRKQASRLNMYLIKFIDTVYSLLSFSALSHVLVYHDALGRKLNFEAGGIPLRRPTWSKVYS